jgi:hypothetical protein
MSAVCRVSTRFARRRHQRREEGMKRSQLTVLKSGLAPEYVAEPRPAVSIA